VNCPKFLSKYREKRRTSKREEPNGYARQNGENTKIVIGNTKKLKLDPRKSSMPIGICPVCRKNKAISIHHIKPLTKGGKDTIKNKVKLCLRCHNIVEEFTDKGKLYSPYIVELIRFKFELK